MTFTNFCVVRSYLSQQLAAAHASLNATEAGETAHKKKHALTPFFTSGEESIGKFVYGPMGSYFQVMEPIKIGNHDGPHAPKRVSRASENCFAIFKRNGVCKTLLKRNGRLEERGKIPPTPRNF